MTPRRRYSTALRAEQTELARRRILDAAGALFLERGYPGTTLAQVAASAGVSVQTVYNVVGGKSVLLKAVYDVMLAGDDEPVPMQDWPTVRAMAAATDARSCLALYARHSRELGERILPLVTILYAQAATGDPDLAAFAATTEGERAIGTGMAARQIAGTFGLRDGLDVQQAADVLWAMTAPDLSDRLVHRRGWGWDRYQEWLGTMLADALLGPAC
jgi:AcrR family transcriptional regulator